MGFRSDSVEGWFQLTKATTTMIGKNAESRQRSRTQSIRREKINLTKTKIDGFEKKQEKKS